jgi:hypothetical protein
LAFYWKMKFNTTYSERTLHPMRTVSGEINAPSFRLAYRTICGCILIRRKVEDVHRKN